MYKQFRLDEFRTSVPSSIVPEWDIEEYKSLNFKLDKHKDEEENSRYIQAGHPKDSITLYNYFEPNPMPDSINHIVSHFALDHLSMAVNLFTPGQYLPIHYDLYGNYKRVNNLPNDADICRIIIMLERSMPGQMMLIGNTVHNSWKAGSVFYWMNATVHTFYNLSTVNRYAVQLTGVPR